MLEACRSCNPEKYGFCKGCFTGEYPISVPGEINGKRLKKRLNIEEIPYSAFYGCSSLNNVTIPNSVTTIAGSAFYQCSSLVNIHLSDNLTSVGSQAFYMCPLP